jgi:hypothetical protein
MVARGIKKSVILRWFQKGAELLSYAKGKRISPENQIFDEKFFGHFYTQEFYAPF